MHLRKRTAILTGVAVVAFALAYGWLRLPPQDTVYHGRLVSDWVRDAVDYDHWEQNHEAREVVISELRERAVPFIAKAVRAECHSDTFWFLLRQQVRLPMSLWLLKEPNSAGKICSASWVLWQMGEPARPAAAVLGRAFRQAGMHAWEGQEVLRDLTYMGPVARGALPYLRKMAADKATRPFQELTFAIFTIARNTNTLAQDLRSILRTGTDLEFHLELLWFQGDEELNGWLLPTLYQTLTDQNRSEKERKNIVWLLGEFETTNQLPRKTLEALLESDTDDWLKREAEKALQRLRPPGDLKP